MSAFKRGGPIGFVGPTVLPTNAEELRAWQKANQAWWEGHPMRYDWKQSIEAPEFSPDFYSEIDRRFFSSLRQFLPWRERPLDSLIDYRALAQSDVLEIGVGNGSHAQLLAERARSFTGIDLTDYAVRSTSERFRCFGVPGTVLQMDAEELDFPSASFDFIWSWGVVHHSAHTRRILEEMHRVLRPGGVAITMVYHRGWWNYYVVNGVLRGLVTGDLLATRSIHRTVQRWTDGAMARYYSPDEWRRLVSPPFLIERIDVYGHKSELIPLPAGSVKDRFTRRVPDHAGRVMTQRLRMGGALVSVLRAQS